MSKYPKQPMVADGAPAWGVALLRDVLLWFRAMMKGPTLLVPYTLASLPDATIWDGTTLPVSDGASGKPTVTAINGAWYYQDGIAV